MNVTGGDFGGLLQTIETDAQNAMGTNPQLAHQIEHKGAGEAKAFALGGHIHDRFKLPVKQGVGHKTTDKRTTAWAHVKGSAVITEPKEGTWHLVIKDLVAKRTVVDRSGVACGQKIPVDYKTGFSCQLDIHATWNTKEDCTLVVEVDLTY